MDMACSKTVRLSLEIRLAFKIKKVIFNSFLKGEFFCKYYGSNKHKSEASLIIFILKQNFIQEDDRDALRGSNFQCGF